MVTKIDLPDLIGKALDHFRANIRPRDVFSKEQIAQVIEQSTGQPLYDGAVEDIRQEMLRRQEQGLGVEAASNDATWWRFGNTRQARSQPLPTASTASTG